MEQLIKLLKSKGFTDQELQQIQEAFDNKCNSIVQERLEIEVNAALEKQDEEHSTWLDKIKEAADVNKQKALEGQESEHTALLEQIIQKYNVLIEKTAVQHRDQLIEQIDMFLEQEIDRAIPSDLIKEAAQNKVSKTLLNNIKQLVGLNEDFISANVREAIQEGKQVIDSQNNEIAQLQKRVLIAESKAMIATNTQNMPKEKRKYMIEQFAHKTPSFIKRNFKLVSEAYDKHFQRSREMVSESEADHSLTKDIDRFMRGGEKRTRTRVPQGEQSVSKEDTSSPAKPTTLMESYLEELKTN